VVTARKAEPKAPAHLSTRGKALWRTLTDAYVFGVHELELLRVGLEWRRRRGGVGIPSRSCAG